MITKEQYESLGRFRVAFNWAVKSSTIPAFTRAELDELESVYTLLGHKLGTRTCGRCVLDMVTVIAKEYFNYGTEEQQLEESNTDGGECDSAPKERKKRVTKKRDNK